MEPLSRPDVQPQPLTVLVPATGWGMADLRDLIRWRELLGNLALRDIKLRYKQTALGFVWALFQPLSTVLVFTLFLGRLAKTADGVPNYPLFVLAGVLPWTFFSSAILTASNSLVANERMVTKTYFPRLLLPASCVLAALWDLALAVGILLAWSAWVGELHLSGLLPALGLVALLACAALGIGSLMAGLIAVQRDFRHLIGFVMPLWMFATPTIYLPLAAMGPAAQTWLPLNPAYGLLLNFRAVLLGTPGDSQALLLSGGVALATLVVGLVVLRRVEATLADTL